MTLSTAYRPEVYEGNGVTKQFSYNFNPISRSYLKVSLEIDGLWVEQTRGWRATYTDEGGVVTFDLAPVVRVAIERIIPQEQPTSYVTSSGFDAKVVETSLDKLTGMVQQIQEGVDRSVKIGIGAGENPDELINDIYEASAKSQQATQASNEAIAAANEAVNIAKAINPAQIQMDSVATALSTIYPVGSVYITTNSTCPLSVAISGSVWEKISEGRVLQGATSSQTAGNTVEAGLPNLTYDIGYTGQQGNGNPDSPWDSGGAMYPRVSQYKSLNASAINPIYGNSNTVQPPAYLVNIFRRIQ